MTSKLDSIATGRYAHVVHRLKADLKPRDHTSSSTMFDVGYEQAKRDILRKMEILLDGPASPRSD